MRNMAGATRILLALALPAASVTAQESRVTVSKSEARCLADNIDAFLSDPDDPVTIYLDLCISTEQVANTVAGGKRTDLPTVKAPAVDAKAKQQAKRIVVSKRALRCLKKVSGDPSFPSAEPYSLVDNCG